MWMSVPPKVITRDGYMYERRDQLDLRREARRRKEIYDAICEHNKKNEKTLLETYDREIEEIIQSMR